MNYYRNWHVVLFTKTNEILHVPHTWIINSKCCWFPYIVSDNKSIFFTSLQISKMINKCVLPNEKDGENYDISILAGPFGKCYK